MSEKSKQLMDNNLNKDETLEDFTENLEGFIEAAFLKMYGDRPPEYDDNDDVCRAWREFDEVMAFGSLGKRMHDAQVAIYMAWRDEVVQEGTAEEYGTTIPDTDTMQ